MDSIYLPKEVYKEHEKKDFEFAQKMCGSHFPADLGPRRSHTQRNKERAWERAADGRREQFVTLYN